MAMTRLGGRLEIDDRLHDTALPGDRVTDDLAVVVPDHGRPIYSFGSDLEQWLRVTMKTPIFENSDTSARRGSGR